MSTFKNNLPDDLKNIWELTRELRIHTSPDTSDAWMRLEQRLDIKQNISPKIYSKRLFSFTKPKLAYAYTILFVFLLLTPIIYNQLTNISVYADRGSQKQVILNDGTIVSINSESILKYSREFNSVSRNVNLNGEGYFQVETSTTPFIVNTENGTITVLGTKFYINSRQDMIEIVVNEGSVSFNPNIENQESENVIIRQGHYINNQTFTPQTIPHPEYPGWIHNKLILNKTNLGTVCDQIERKFDVKIKLDSNQLNRISITGVIDAEDLDGVLTTLAILSQRSYRFEKETYIFY